MSWVYTPDKGNCTNILFSLTSTDVSVKTSGQYVDLLLTFLLTLNNLNYTIYFIIPKVYSVTSICKFTNLSLNIYRQIILNLFQGQTRRPSQGTI